MTRGKFTRMETRELRSAKHSLDASEGETWEKQSAKRWENATGILSVQLERDQYVPGRNRWKWAYAKTPHKNAWRIRIFKILQVCTQTKGKTYKRTQTGFKLWLPSIAMENVYRVFRQLFDVLPRYISCLKSQERYPQICKDFKKIYCPVPF